ncbi:MAG: hypothetical protein WCB85_14020 [Candidatus Dormiibacterota bacterium]
MIAAASLVGGADDLWLILAAVLAFGAGTLVQIWMPREQWVAAAHTALGLTAPSLAIFEGLEARASSKWSSSFGSIHWTPTRPDRPGSWLPAVIKILMGR